MKKAATRMQASTGELHGTMIASRATSDGCAYAYVLWNTLQAIQKKIDLHILMPCKPIACPPSMKQPIAKLTVITIFALHPLSTGPRAYGTCILQLACRQASRMQQELMLLLLCSPSASTCTKQMHSTLTTTSSCIDNEPTMRHAEHSLLCILQTIQNMMSR